MKVLLDTNIIIHREASRVINNDIGQLFKWLDALKYEKYIHPLTRTELEKNKDPKTVETMLIKTDSYKMLSTLAGLDPKIKLFIEEKDKTDNDRIDSRILNELVCQRVNYLITEDNGVIPSSTPKTLKILLN